MCNAIPNQFLCNDIQHGKPVLDNRTQLSIQSLFNQFRQRITIDFLCFFIGDSCQVLFCSVNVWRKSPLWNWSNVFNTIRNAICILHNHFICLFFSQIRKLFQHFVCCPKIQRRLEFGIVITLSSLQNLSEFCIIRVHKMHVTGCTNWHI